MQAESRYPVTILSVSWASSSKKGTDCLDVTMRIKEGNDSAGEIVLGSIWMTPDAIGMAQGTFQELGVTKEQLASEAFWMDPGEVLAGRDAAIVTEASEFGPRVRYINGPARSFNKPNPDPAAAARKAFAAYRDLRAKKDAKVLAGAARGVTSSSPSESAPGEDDDVPF